MLSLQCVYGLPGWEAASGGTVNRSAKWTRQESIVPAPTPTFSLPRLAHTLIPASLPPFLCLLTSVQQPYTPSCPISPGTTTSPALIHPIASFYCPSSIHNFIASTMNTYYVYNIAPVMDQAPIALGAVQKPNKKLGPAPKCFQSKYQTGHNRWMETDGKTRK